MVKPFFSIIIPTLNEEEYLPQLLNDLQRQTFQNFEVIVVDGYSEDKTQDLAKQFIPKLPYLVVINSQQRNLPYQRNLGVASSNGEYLVFLDADVAVPENYLAKIHDALSSKKVDYLTTWLEADNKSIKHELLMNMTNLLIEASKLIDKPFVCGGNAIVSKKAFTSINGFNENLKVHEDYDLSVRLNKAGFKLYVLKKPKTTISMRRYVSQGTENVIGKYALYTARFFLKGAPTTDIFQYEMGGQVYQKPTFSVIIPTLNEEIYLPRLLTDLSRQKIKPFEVIVVDGGSTDATIAEAQKFIEKIPLQIFETKFKNVSSQRNFGAKQARGKYLVFFDADVQITPLFFQKLEMQFIKHPQKFATTYVNADSKNFYDKVMTTFINIGADFSVFIEKPFAGGWDTIVEKDAFWKVNGFREDIKHAEDVDLSLRLYEAGFVMKVFRQPRVIYSLRRFRAEGRIKSIRNNATAALHIFTKGPITEELFSYPMGGGWYKIPRSQKKKKTFSEKVKKYMVRFRKWMES